MIMLTRSSERNFNPMRYTGNNIHSVLLKMIMMMIFDDDDISIVDNFFCVIDDTQFYHLLQMIAYCIINQM